MELSRSLEVDVLRRMAKFGGGTGEMRDDRNNPETWFIRQTGLGLGRPQGRTPGHRRHARFDNDFLETVPDANGNNDPQS
jgi:hypothetical protein